MKNFDVEREQRAATDREDRAFVLGGQTFHALAEVNPDVLTRFEQIDDKKDTPLSETLATVDSTILELIENETDDNAHDRYRHVRETTPDLGIPTLLELAQWLVGVQAGRPTEPSQPSSPSPGPTTGTSSTGDSSSEEAPEE
jgi:hypothetical protein